MQNDVVKAFRQRLVRAGFTDIHIYVYADDLYNVRCISPSGKRIYRRMSSVDMFCTPRLVWFD